MTLKAGRRAGWEQALHVRARAGGVARSKTCVLVDEDQGRVYRGRGQGDRARCQSVRVVVVVMVLEGELRCLCVRRRRTNSGFELIVGARE